MRGQPVEEHAVMADDHSAAREIFQRLVRLLRSARVFRDLQLHRRIAFGRDLN